MDFEKFTEKSKGFIQAAQTLAMRNGHQSIEPEHLLKVMLDDQDGLVSKLLKAADANVARLRTDVESAIAKFPVVEGSGAQLRISTDFAKTADNALKLAEKSGDKFVTAERIIQSMLLAKKMDVSGYLEDAGLEDQKLNQAINDMRKGRTADSALSLIHI